MLQLPLPGRAFLLFVVIIIFGANTATVLAQGPTLSIVPKPPSSGWVHLTASGLSPTLRYDVQRSVDMSTWSTITTVASSIGAIGFDDVTVGNVPRALYRLKISNAVVGSLPSRDIWIAARSDGLPGTGTQSDPFDGSTTTKLDAVLYSFYFTSNLGVHLMGPGPFRTDVNHRWNVRPGWVISGDGMYSTTVQLVGSVVGWSGVCVFTSDPNISTDNATIRDLTIDCNWPGLAATAPDGAGGEKNSGASAVFVNGNNNLLERVRCMNSYGSWENKKEQFAMFLTGPRNGNGTNNVIRDCRAEMPWGSYGNPFALAGWIFSPPYYLITNSKVVGCTAVGLKSGLSTGFTSGGVNMANVKDCEVDANTFIDCNSAAYTDVGQVDGLRVTNNTVVRGWMIVGLRCTGLKHNITISGNNFQVQNRFINGASYGAYIDSGPTTNLTVSNNHFSFDGSGGGIFEFWGIRAWEISNATVSGNVFEYIWPLYNSVSGSGITYSNNRMTDGALVNGLPN